jgi:hypothetical protein
MAMGEIVYSLCALTSLACAVLLIRSWMRTRARLLAWASACFVGFTINNVLLVFDFVLYKTETDLSVARTITAFVSILALVVGLVWSSDQR